MKDLREYENWARVVQERISREFGELKGMNDRRKLSELSVLAATSVIGIGHLLSEDEDIEGIESESDEELAAERAMWEAVGELSKVAENVEAELQLAENAEDADITLSTAQEADTTLSTAQKVAERWHARREAG
jgi:hypothetical protein